jgi:hypothetical protein
MSRSSESESFFFRPGSFEWLVSERVAIAGCIHVVLEHNHPDDLGDVTVEEGIAPPLSQSSSLSLVSPLPRPRAVFFFRFLSLQFDPERCCAKPSRQAAVRTALRSSANFLHSSGIYWLWTVLKLFQWRPNPLFSLLPSSHDRPSHR